MSLKKVVAIPIAIVGIAILVVPLAIYVLLVCGSYQGVKYYYG
ncbi:MAG: hypothetical protein ABWX92_10495 [Mycetocola sp.]